MIFVYALWTLQLVTSAALLTKILTTYQKELDTVGGHKISACDIFDKRDKGYQCSQLEGGVVSLLLVILLLVSNYIN